MKLNLQLRYDPVIPLLSTSNRRDKRTCPTIQICIRVLIATNWKEPRWPSTGKWIDYGGIFIQWKTTQQWKGKNYWGYTSLKNTKLNEKAFPKSTYHIIPLMWNSRISKTSPWEEKNQNTGWQRRVTELTGKGQEGTF